MTGAAPAPPRSCPRPPGVRSLGAALACALLLGACGTRAAPPTVVSLTPVDGPLGVSAQQVLWAEPAPADPTPGDVRGTSSTTVLVGLDGRRAVPGDLVLRAAGAASDGAGGWLVPDRFDGPPTGERSVDGPADCPGGLASRWEVVEVVEAVAELRLLDVVLLC